MTTSSSINGCSVGDIKRVVSTIDSEIDNRGSQERQCTDNWTAQASAAYQSDLDNIDQSLDQLAKSVGESADPRKSMDTRIARSSAF